MSAPDGVELNSSWTFRDGAESIRVNKLTASCRHNTPGVKTVTLHVSYTGTDGEVSASDTVDITVVELSLDGPETVTRGGTAEYRATLKPAGLNVTYDWKFTGKGSEIPGPSVSSTSGPNNPSTWRGPMVVTGTIEVTAKVDNKPFKKSLKTTERVRIHEGVIEDPDGVYTSHAAKGLQKIKEIPLNPWAEEQVQYFNLINDPNWESARQAFETDRRTKFIARAVKVLTKFAEHPPNKYPLLPTPTYEYD